MITDITRLTNAALVAETKRVAELERRTTVDLLALLIELERRALHLTLGYSSMFTYCTQALSLSEQAAFKRITAARAARRYPIILQRLADGELTLSSIKILAPHLTDEKVGALLDAARHKSTRELEQLIASAHPQPDIPASVRALPAPKAQPPNAQPLALLHDEPTPPAPTAPITRPVVAPVATTRYLLRVTVSQDTHDTLQQIGRAHV